MKSTGQHPQPAGALVQVAGHFQALVKGKPFITKGLSGLVCLRSELDAARSSDIWKIHAAGQVAAHRTMIGFYIDRALGPGTYDLVGNEQIKTIYHLTPKRMATIFHSRDLQFGSMTLLECNLDTRRLRGTFEFSIPALGFEVRDGAFDLLCQVADGVRASLE